MPNGFELLSRPIAPDILGSFEQGRARQRQTERERLADQELRAELDRGNRFRELALQAYGAQTPAERQQVVSQAAAADPQGALALGQQLGAQDKSQHDLMMERMGITASALVNAPEQMRPMLYKSMLPELRKFVPTAPEEFTPDMLPVAQQFLAMRGGQPASVQAFRQMTQGMKPEDIERARRIELGLEGRASSGGFGFKTATLPDGREALVVTDPRTGNIRPATMEEIQGFLGSQASASTPLAGQTPAEKAASIEQAKADVQLRTAPEIERAKQTAGVTAKTGAERQAAFIDEGLRAADALPVINRAAELLESVGTGGLEAAKLAATNFFGVTGADEGELSNNLGKAVLSQLRATFGAAFTEREGARLQEIEAGFGKSTAVNKRLIGQTKAIVERAGRRGIEAARAAGDEFTAQEIERALRMTLAPAAKSAPPRASAGPQPADAQSAGAEVTATGPNGQKLVLRNGAWVQLQ